MKPLLTLITFVVAAAFTLTGCAKPLGTTTYPPADLADIEGTWELRLETPDGMVAPANPPRVFVDVSPQGPRRDAPPWNHWIARDGAPVFSESARKYFLTLRRDDPTPPLSDLEPLKPLTLMAGFIRTPRCTLVTFQPAPDAAWPLVMAELVAPVQHTMRIRGASSGDKALVIECPRTPLVYIPIRMAGELRRMPQFEGRDARQMQSVDDVFAALDALPDDQWQAVATAVKQSDAR